MGISARAPAQSLSAVFLPQVRARLGLVAFSRPGTLDLLLSAGLAVGALALSLSHPWSHAFVGEAQNGDAAYWDLNAESWARGYVSSKVPDIRTGYSVFLGIVYVLTSPDFRNAFAAQAVLFSIGVVLVFVVGKCIG